MSLQGLQEALNQELIQDLGKKADRGSPTDVVTWIENNFWIPETRSTIRLMEYQKRCLSHILTPREDEKFPYSVIIWSDIKKSAKALSLDTIIPTPNGYKTMGEIGVGDFVFSMTGKPARVEAVTGVMENHSCYRISFSNGEKVIADAGHLWYLHDRRSKGKDGGNGWGKLEIKTTEDICDNFLVQDYTNTIGYRTRCRRYSLPITNGIDGEKNNLPIHPYVFGYWLGDGHSDSARITTADVDVIEYIKSLGYPITKNSAKYSWSLTNGTRGGSKETKEKTVGGRLNKLGVINNKHIPTMYLRASREQRLELLCGLMDSDGTVGTDGRCSFLSTNKNLAHDVSELLSSLGIKNQVRVCGAKLNGRFISKAYRISIQAYSCLPIFKIGRKISRLQPRNSAFSRSDRVVVENIERVDSVPVKCIQVDGGSYMITRSFIPTHNSTIAAAVAQWMAMTRDYAEIYIIANDLKQADSRVAHYFRRSLDLNTDMRGRYRQRGYKTIFDNGSFVEAIPIDPSGEAGSNADAIFWSELWGAHQEAQQRMWVEMTLSPTKFGKSFRWVESYAGYSEESELLYSLYESGVLNGEKVFDDDLEAYKNQAGRMFCLWNSKPRCPWQTNEYYASEQAVLTPDEFNRMHRNQWASATEIFVPIEWWDACNRPYPAEKPYEPQIIAIDAGISDDNFGLVVGARHPELNEDIVTRTCKAWKPPTGGKIDFVGTDENKGPELFIREYCRTHNVVELTYDPYQLEDLAGRLRRSGVVFCKPFNQGNQRLIADSELRAKIRDRRIWHNGDVALTQHIKNANAQKDEKEDRKIRIVKRTQNLKIDLCVALSMCSHEIMRLNL